MTDAGGFNLENLFASRVPEPAEGASHQPREVRLRHRLSRS